MANRGFRVANALCPFYGASISIIPIRTMRYHAWGGMKRGKNRIPLDWRKVDHNPAKIPWAWIPDKWKQEHNIDYEYEKELAKYIPGYEPKIPDEEHPDYHEIVNYSFHSDTKLVEGFRQALCLTKSVLYEEMPQNIQQLESIDEIPDQDEKVVPIFQKANLFDIDPVNLDFENSKGRRYQDNFLVYPTVQRICPSVLENLIRLCYQHPLSSRVISTRMLAKDVECSTYMQRKCDVDPEMTSHIDNNWLVSFKSQGGMHLLSKCPLKPFANAKEIENTKSVALPNIFPVLPVVDLIKKNIYKNITSTGLSNDATLSNLHTLFLLNLSGLTAEELYGQMICQLFTCLHSRAVAKYGAEPLDLPEPISAQAIGSDGQNFHFACMQLNTTMMDSDQGVKNMVWTNAPYEDSSLGRRYLSIPMYDKCAHNHWESREYYSGYDPSVFRTFLAMWLNGTV